jgi:bifunctional non-homologous end joining protein LigD
MEYQFGEITVTCSNVDRVVFPDSGITKGDVLAYYRDIAEAMVPELHGRPLTLERFTKGLGGGGFYQKHYQKHFPSWIGRVELGSKTRVVYPVCNDAAALVYFANQGTLAFHVAGGRLDGNPDQIVFDLDPPDKGFDLARHAAHAVREILTELELPAFVKTSGSKGLHVVVPTDARDGWDEVGSLCKQVSARLCERHPELITTEFYKKDRKGRLFLDVMRNAPGATVVAAWSVRGRPGAPVSAPIAWSEVDDLELTPDGIRLRDVPTRIAARGNPWSNFRAALGSVSRALVLERTLPKARVLEDVLPRAPSG